MLAFFFELKKSGNFIQLNYFKYMKLGFIGTGEITKAVVSEAFPQIEWGGRS